MKFQRWMLLFFAMVLLGCTDSEEATQNIKEVAKEPFPWFKDRGRTDDMTPIELSLVDEKSGDALYFKIPKAYLTDTRNWSGGKQDRIKIETGLPELKPRPGNIWVKKDDSNYEKKIKFFRNGLFIMLHSRSQSKSPSIAAGARRQYKKSYEKQSQLSNGLEHYKSIACTNIKRTPEGKIIKTEKRCRERTDEYFLTPLGFEGDWAAFRCTRLEANLGGGCVVRASYRGKALEYIFRRSQIDRWVEFDGAARNLLDNFLIDSYVSNES